MARRKKYDEYDIVFWVIALPFVIAFIIIKVIINIIIGTNRKKTFNSYNLTNVDSLSGEQFEHYVAESILPKMGFTNISVTKVSGDFGVDIIAYKNGTKYAIQCKRSLSTIGVKAIQEVVSGVSYYNCNKGIVITNNYYTSNAKKLAKTTNVELYDRDVLRRYI